MPWPVLALTGHERHVAAVLLDDHAVLRQLGLDAVGVGVGLVDLVEGHHDRHLGGARVVDGLEGLRHDAVIRGDHDHRDVGDLRAAGAHGRERLVAGRVEEHDAAAILLDLAGADVLGDAAALAGGDGRGADGVEQAGLAVVDVPHDGHDRAPAAPGRPACPPRRGPPWRPRATALYRSSRSLRRPGARPPRSRGRWSRGWPCHGR